MSKVQVSAGPVSGEAPVFGLQMAPSHCDLTWWPFLCVRARRELSGDCHSSYQDTSPIGSGPHPHDLMEPSLPPERLYLCLLYTSPSPRDS